jgi:hypothetical protein
VYSPLRIGTRMLKSNAATGSGDQYGFQESCPLCREGVGDCAGCLATIEQPALSFHANFTVSEPGRRA